VRGIPITKYCDENHLTPKDRLELFIKVCQAIQHAHQKGVIHRDIKPSNILVTVNDGAPTPKVIDFGIAKATQGKLTDATVFTAFEQFIGTPVYMSPEQAEMSSLDIDTRSDIYSLGVLLYELLAGRPPFDPKAFAQAGVDQIRKQIREVEPPRPSMRLRTLDEDERTTIAQLRGTAASTLSLELRGDLDWIVMRCIEKDRTRRYDTANGLAMDIQRHLRNEPVIARPPSTGYLLGKLIRRHRWGFMAGSVLCATVAVGVLTSVALTLRALRAEKDQRQLRGEAEDSRRKAEEAEKSARQSEDLAAAGRARAEELLAFYFTELAEELSDFGQASLLQRMTARAVSYFEGLPAALHTRETRAAHALALAGVGAIGWSSQETMGEYELGHPVVRVQLTRSIDMLQELERSGPMTPLMRLAFAAVVTVVADQSIRERRASEAVSLCARAEAVLAPALADKEWGLWAMRMLTKLQRWKGICYRNAGNYKAALTEYERASATAAEVDRRIPRHRRTGLRVAQLKNDIAWAQHLLGNYGESRKLTAEVCATFREFVEREPFLVTARAWYLMAATRQAEDDLRQWRFAAAAATDAETTAQVAMLLKLEPENAVYRRNLAMKRDREFSANWKQGEFSAAEAACRKLAEVVTEDSVPWLWSLVVTSRANLARLHAAVGRNQEAEALLSEALALHARLAVVQQLTGNAGELHWARGQGLRRAVDFQRLDWLAMRNNAEETLAKLETLHASEVAEQGTIDNAKSLAGLDHAVATFELGDYSITRKLYANPLPALSSSAASRDLQQRFERVGQRLLRVHVVARAGEQDVARAELAAVWPEVEDVFAAGPELLFNRVQMARALSVRAEIDGEVTQKREWLNGAVEYLRPAATQGKLTRYEREVLLGRIENQLSALATSPSP
jgi:tetratricopeptide (TPR) repeat protein